MLDDTPLALYGYGQLVTATLTALDGGRGAHAYLISGPPQAGKARIARVLAAAVICPQPVHGMPCGNCGACRRVAVGGHPDLELLTPGGLCDERDHDHATDRSRDVRICQVRRAERFLSLTPFEGSRRVVIIDPADSMNPQSADAFLKTLEEPPERSLLLLISAEPERLPDTIRSRCRLLSVGLLSVAAISQALVAAADLDEEQANVLARLSGGRMGWALAAARDSEFSEARRHGLAEAERLARLGRSERLAAAERLATAFSRDREDVYRSVTLWIDWWRDVLLCAAGTPTAMGNTDHREQIAAYAAAVGAGGALQALAALRRLRRDLESNVSPRLAIDAMMLGLPQPGRGEPAGRSS